MRGSGTACEATGQHRPEPPPAHAHHQTGPANECCSESGVPTPVRSVSATARTAGTSRQTFQETREGITDPWPLLQTLVESEASKVSEWISWKVRAQGVKVTVHHEYH